MGPLVSSKAKDSNEFLTIVDGLSLVAADVSTIEIEDKDMGLSTVVYAMMESFVKKKNMKLPKGKYRLYIQIACSRLDDDE